MLSLSVRTKKSDIGGCKTQTSIDFDSIEDATMDARSINGQSGFNASIYEDYVVLSVGWDGTVRVTREQALAILESLKQDSDYEDLVKEWEIEDAD